ncbi:hypothetical protein PFISCL1PPCAC_15848, partial [Pristionchus fissidentatus]
FLLISIVNLAESSKVLLISFDGFRHDLLNETMVSILRPHFRFSFGKKEKICFRMLTVTAANHMSIVTGLTEDKHGIIGNFFWDTKKQMM